MSQSTKLAWTLLLVFGHHDGFGKCPRSPPGRRRCADAYPCCKCGADHAEQCPPAPAPLVDAAAAETSDAGRGQKRDGGDNRQPARPAKSAPREAVPGLRRRHARHGTIHGVRGPRRAWRCNARAASSALAAAAGSDSSPSPKSSRSACALSRSSTSSSFAINHRFPGTVLAECTIGPSGRRVERAGRRAEARTLRSLGIVCARYRWKRSRLQSGAARAATPPIASPSASLRSRVDPAHCWESVGNGARVGSALSWAQRLRGTTERRTAVLLILTFVVGVLVGLLARSLSGEDGPRCF